MRDPINSSDERTSWGDDDEELVLISALEHFAYCPRQCALIHLDILVTYDVTTDTPAGRKRLRKVAEACVAFGQRVQYSVFECLLTEAQLEVLRHKLLGIIQEDEDSLRIYRLAQPRERYLWIYGVKREIDYQGPLIV